ncbi:hypothetical protein ACWEF6_01790 [Amycolatopsis sp. NPDC004772]
MTEYFKYEDDNGTHFYRIRPGADQADTLYADSPINLKSLSARFVRRDKTAVSASDVPEDFRVGSDKYKIGDRLKGTASWANGDEDYPYEGEYRGEVSEDGWPEVHGDDGDAWYLDTDKPITVLGTTPSLSFVGPEPEVTVPTVTTPFRVATTGTFGRIEDSRGNQVAEFLGDLTSESEDVELAALAVELLNEHFGAK